jgi:CRISPR-associated protein Csx17
VDFARAIAGLGIDRGLTSFVRYGFLKRSGKAFLAIPLARFETRNSAKHANLLAEIDGWLDSFRRACAGDNIQARFITSLRRLDSAIFQYCRHGDASRFGEIVRALGQCEHELALNPDKPLQHNKRVLGPVPALSAQWLSAAQEDSSEFHLALALAAMRSTGAVGALRTNIETVIRKPWGWAWADPQDRYSTVWSGTDLLRNLQAVLERRLMDATRAGLTHLPLESAFPADAEDIALFLANQIDDSRLEEWLWGLMLIDLEFAQSTDLAAIRVNATHQPLHRAYALLKLLFLPHYSALQTKDGQCIRPEPAILNHLRAGRLEAACRLATRRLRASGYMAMPSPVSGGSERSLIFSMPVSEQRRLPAALLIPLANPTRIKSLMLRPEGQNLI